MPVPSPGPAQGKRQDLQAAILQQVAQDPAAPEDCCYWRIWFRTDFRRRGIANRKTRNDEGQSQYESDDSADPSRRSRYFGAEKFESAA
jgi:hypothetical protein